MSEEHGHGHKHAPAQKPAGETRTVEAWGQAKGMLPEIKVTPATKRTAATRTHNPAYSAYAAAFAAKPEGLEMTEAEFDAAIAEAANHRYG